MRHFNYFGNSAPFPGICVSCRGNVELFDLGMELQSGGNALICLRCIDELAAFTGYAPKKTYEDRIAVLEADLVSRETEINKVPNLVEDLINGIRSSVTDFVFAVSYSDSPSSEKPVQKSEPVEPGHDEVSKTSNRHDKAPKQPISK